MQKTFHILTWLIIFVSCKEKKSAEPTQDAKVNKPDTTVISPTPIDTSERELSFDELRIYLPQAGNGFAINEPPSGENAFIGTSGIKYFSFARQLYRKGDMVINVEIVDYLKDKKTFNGILNMYGFSTGLDNNVLSSKPLPLSINGVKGLATIYKQEKKSTLVLSIGDRFLVNVIADGVKDIEILKKLAITPALKDLVSISREESTKPGA